jgi:mannose-1-phosphate guanylyltransferase
MKAFILAAGFGTRLRPLTEQIAKPLVPVCNVPAILYTLAAIKQAGITDVIINLHYKSDEITAYFAAHNNFGLNIFFSYEDNILGTGGGVKKCEELLRDDYFLLINGDILMDLDIRELYNAHALSTHPATIVIYQHQHATTIGAVGMVGEKIVDLNNVRHTNLGSPYIYAGAALLSPEIFPYLRPEFSCIVRSAFVALMAQDRLPYYLHRGDWFDIGTFSELYESSFAMLHNEAYHARMRRHGLPVPCSRGDHCSIADNVILKNAIVGDNCVIAEGVMLQNSIVMPGEVITSKSVIQNSVVAAGKNISIDYE